MSACARIWEATAIRGSRVRDASSLWGVEAGFAWPSRFFVYCVYVEGRDLDLSSWRMFRELLRCCYNALKDPAETPLLR